MESYVIKFKGIFVDMVFNRTVAMNYFTPGYDVFHVNGSGFATRIHKA